MRKTLIFLAIIILFVAIILIFPSTRSMASMYVHSSFQERTSVMAKNNFDLHIPGGLKTPEKDWYPFVMTYNDTNIASAIGEDIDLTILYNFGAFENGRSTLYKEDSDYYSAFYGAYVIESKDKNREYGFKDDEMVLNEVEKVAAHDLEALVLRGLGHKNPKVKFNPIGISTNVEYLGYPDWTMIDATIDSPSPLHKVTENQLSYIQYGKPPKDYNGEDFPPAKLSGRIYGRYFEELDVTILLYIIAPDFGVVDRVDKGILRGSRVRQHKNHGK